MIYWMTTMMKQTIFSFPAAAMVVALVPGGALAQHHGTQAQRALNDEDRADLLARIRSMETRITAARANGTLTRTKASILQRKLVTTRQSYQKVTRSQHFLSAAESASYNRTLDDVDAQLPAG